MKKLSAFFLKHKKKIILIPILFFILLVIVLNINDVIQSKNKIASECASELRYSPAYNNYFVNEHFQEYDDFYSWSYDRDSQEGNHSKWYKNKNDFIEVCTSREELFNCNNYQKFNMKDEETNKYYYFFKCWK